MRPDTPPIPENVANRWSHLGPELGAGRTLAIVNPVAGRKTVARLWRTSPVLAVEGALAEVGLEADIALTENPDDATRLAREAVADRRAVVIAAGGDGTVEDVLQPLVGSPTALGILPLGSAMNLARSLGVPRDLAGAAQLIAKGRVLAADVGRVGEERYFVEAAGVGLDPVMLGDWARDRGRGARIRQTIAWLRRAEPVHVAIRADGRDEVVRTLLVRVANSPYFGMGSMLAPGVRLDDGRLGLFVYRDWGVRDLARHQLAAWVTRSWPLPADGETFFVRTVDMEVIGNRRLPVHADGRLVGTTPVHIAVVPGGLRVFAGDGPGVAS
jgi:diacylglycerol kinase (ATP)